MAIRRALGRGLEAFGQTLGDYYAREAESQRVSKRQTDDDERALKARREAEAAQHENSLEDKFYTNNPNALSSRLRKPVDNRDAALGISGQVAKADSLSKMPTEEDILSQFRNAGGRDTLDSSNITRSGNSLNFDPNPGGASVLAGLQSQGKSRRDMLTAEANQPDRVIEEMSPDGSKTAKAVNPRTMGSVTTGLSAKQEGANEGAKKVAGAPGEIEATNAINKGTFDERFREEQKLENMKATIQLANWRKQNEGKAAPAALAAATAAVSSVKQIEDIIALATEINKGNPIGTADVYSGIRNSVGQLPWAGPALGAGMDVANSVTSAIKDGDPTIVAKANQLQSLRRAAAIALIRAAGDPRPSNADVDGVINAIPGVGESNFATAMKATTMRNTVTMLPEILKAHPELVGSPDAETGRGLMVIQMAMQEAKKRATQGAQSGRDPELNNPPANRIPLASLGGAQDPKIAPPQATPAAPKRLKLGPDGQWR